MNGVKEEYVGKEPDWYDQSKLTKIQFDVGENSERGWAIQLDDGTYRLANQPVMGMLAGRPHPDIPQWGDIVEKTPNGIKLIQKWEGYDFEEKAEIDSEPTQAT
jgi:hypothetical protein